jgi:hypothetical protein
VFVAGNDRPPEVDDGKSVVLHAAHESHLCFENSAELNINLILSMQWVPPNRIMDNVINWLM